MTNVTDDLIGPGPYIVWENYGNEGWHPKSYENIKTALVAQRFNSQFVVTKLVDYEVVEKGNEQDGMRAVRPKTRKRRGRGVAKPRLGKGLTAEGLETGTF
jgi:hypothetical protein